MSNVSFSSEKSSRTLQNMPSFSRYICDILWPFVLSFLQMESTSFRVSFYFVVDLPATFPLPLQKVFTPSLGKLLIIVSRIRSSLQHIFFYDLFVSRCLPAVVGFCGDTRLRPLLMFLSVFKQFLPPNPRITLVFGKSTSSIFILVCFVFADSLISIKLSLLWWDGMLLKIKKSKGPSE